MTQAPPDRDAAAESADATAESALEESIAHGVERLERPWPALLATGAIGGVDVSLGVLALLVVEEATGSRLLAALGFGIGFIILVLAKSELFTENFLVPIVAVVADYAGWWAVVRLWAGTALTNLVGGWVMTGIFVVGVPRLVEAGTAQRVASHFPDLGVGWATFASAVLAGTVMTLFTWMERATSSTVAKLIGAVTAAFLLVATPLLHSIVTSLEMFAALHAGAPFGYADWARLFGLAVAGNAVGGLGLVTLLRLVQVGGEKIREERRRDEPGRTEQDSPQGG